MHRFLIFSTSFFLFWAGAWAESGIKLFAENMPGPTLAVPLTMAGAKPEKWGGTGVEAQLVRENGDVAIRATLGGTDTYPGFQLRPSDRKFWDFSKYGMLLCDVENLDPKGQTDIHVRINSLAPDGKTPFSCFNTMVLNPGEKREFRLPFSRIQTDLQWTLPRLTTGPRGTSGKPNIYTNRIVGLSFYTRAPFLYARNGAAQFKISNLRLAEYAPTQRLTPITANAFFPFVDRFGQYRHDEWPEKISTPADLRKNREKEAALLARYSSGTEKRTPFGGDAAGPQLKSTGFFRTEKYQGKWHLVDPSGRLYLMQGMNGVHFNGGVNTKSRENWFESKPAGTSKEIPFVQENLRLKYGENAQKEIRETALKRLKAWGFNALGAWSDEALCKSGKIPYTVILNDCSPIARIGKKNLYYPDFYDAFDPAFAENLDRLFRERYAYAVNDPYCIGFFINNELKFGDPGKFAILVLSEPSASAAKQEFRRRLEKKYTEITRLNAAWKVNCKSWRDFLDSPLKLTKPEGAALKDLTEFEDVLIDEYYKVCRAAVRRNAPQQLYLGSRFRSSMDMRRPGLLETTARYCDVISVNNYVNTIAHLKVGKGLPDVPFLIGEYSFEVRERGIFNDTLCPAGINQQDRARTLESFWRGLLTHPNFVGAFWFYYRDQPLTGRSGDGENYPSGFVDICDTPYEEMGAAGRKIEKNMYRYRRSGTLTLPLEALPQEHIRKAEGK